MSFARKLMIAVALVTMGVGSVHAAEKVGEAVLIKTSVTGGGQDLATKSPVYRDERIRSSSNGLGEFVFRDGTKFAVGRNSSIVIDKFVFDDSKTFKNLTVSAAKGSFRWISGGSPSSAYKINTPAGTIGVRGTGLDVYVGTGGVTAVVLLSGAAEFCTRTGCQRLRKRCDYIIATPQGGITPPERVSLAVLKELKNARALPFITGDQRLSSRFRGAGDCSLAGATRVEKSETRPEPQRSIPTRTATPSKPDKPDCEPSDGGGEGEGEGEGGGEGESF